MKTSIKTITTLLTISICINIFCLGFIASQGIHHKRHKDTQHHVYSGDKYKKNADMTRGKDNPRKPMSEELAADNEKVVTLRKDMAAVITAEEVDFAKVEALLKEIKTKENEIREKMEKRFLERLGKMNQEERQNFVEKMKARIEGGWRGGR